MASNKQTKKGKNGKKGRIEEKPPVVHNSYNIQIGSQNQMISVPPPGTKDNEEGLSKEEFIIEVLVNTLSPDTEMSIGQLRDSFEKRYKKLKPGTLMTFADIAGTDLLSFLRNHPTWFNLSIGKKKNYYVKPIHGRKTTTPKRDSETDLPSDSDFNTSSCVGEKSDNEYFSFSEFEDSENFGMQSNRSTNMMSYTSSSEDESISEEGSSREHEDSWKVIKRKKKRTGFKPDALNVMHRDKKMNYVGLNELEIKNINVFENLIEKLEDLSVLFHKSDSLYEKKPCEFMLDVVSMWNTPGRTTSYIVLGVKAQSTLPHVLTGIKISRSDEFYQDLFQSDFFNLRPKFSYFEVTYFEMLFGIIEIPASSGYGQPTITKATQPIFKSDQLWYRPNSKRKICPFKDLTVGLIFQWFSPKDETSQSNALNAAAKDSREVDQVSMLNTSISDTTSTEEDGGVVVVTTPEKLYKVVGHFEKSNFVLISGDLPSGLKHLEAVSLVPWIAVYDFDINSRDKGLLSANEQFLRNRRSLHITNWCAPAQGMSENGTVWTFLRGSRDAPASRIKGENEVRSWLKTVKSNLKTHIDQLQKFACDYTVLTVIILWPHSELLAPFLLKFLGILDDEIEPSPKLVMCLPSDPADNSKSKSVYNLLCSEHGENLTVVKMDLNKFCHGMKYCLQNKYKTQKVKFELPTADGALDPNINESEAAWFKEDMEVLYIANTYNKTDVSVSLLKEEAEQFFRGGTIPWYVWYVCGTGLDVDRDIKNTIIRKISGFIEENKSCILTLYHEPGSGGTTLGQRVLWDFHNQMPCAQIKLNTASTISDIAERVQLLHDKTHQPVLLLLDGEDEFRVKTLMRTLKRGTGVSIILYVKRYSNKITVTEGRDKVYLKGTVSADEAMRLAIKFGDRCDDEKKKKNLNLLSEEVNGGKSHYLYEFGLTTYLHEFKGVTAYVRGYLDLENNPSRDLLPWQTILAYLSLVYYYGQSSLPCQFFSALMYLPPNYDVTVDDFSHPSDRFVVPTINEGKSKNVRICHYIIAKEILEQILSRNNPVNDERGTDLSSNARNNLGGLCKEFIDYAGRKKLRTTVHSSNIIHILAKTFIFRDNRDCGKYTDNSKRRSLVSKALTDVCSEPPLFTDRLQILEKLTLAFPEDPNFHAHLGRFYALCRSNDDDDKAENCFRKALDLCEGHTDGKVISDIDDRWRLSVMHIYHMYGTVLQRRISRYIDSFGKQYKREEFLKKLEELIEHSNTACSYFQKCRDYAPPGHETIAGHIGEIFVRLSVCEFVQKKFDKRGSKGIQHFLSFCSDKDNPSVHFVKDSVSLIDSLIMECYTEVEEDDADCSLQKAVLWYNNLFNYKSIDLEKYATGNDIFSHRLRIVAKKLKYGTKEGSINLLETITSEEDVIEIVQLYEKIFLDLNVSGFRGTRKDLEHDYKEWLIAIRHRLFPEDYTLEKVLQTVRQWYDHLKSPFSRFYLFIVTSLLGFGIEKDDSCNTELLLEANIHKGELHKISSIVLKPKYPREWLGNNRNGIKCLHPGTRLLGLGIHAEERDEKGVNQSELRICKGTICAPNKQRLSGLIDLDLGDNTVPIKVFFIPKRAKLESSQYAGRRVEFILGFSLDHGYEAFAVKLLKKYGCCKCRTWEEITSLDDEVPCPQCGNCISRSDLNAEG